MELARVFFFSSRRRHTRWTGDWRSDVCSSDLTSSLPVGLYVISPSLPVRGALVLVCLPAKVGAFAHARGYVPRGEECPNGVAPIGKPVAAIAGDTVAVTPAGLVVNGVAVPNSQPLATDRKGRPLSRMRVARWVVE